jgi:trans-2,3-dihydro-3-hydroxyanthranilate isomerase
MKRRFVTLDVFTDTRFTGNPLAVVLDAEGLDAASMQAIAREFNLSETVFVSPAEQSATRARVRIFTPANELPFAGHPTIGTAVLLGRIDGGGDRDFVLEETVGPVPCRVRATGPDSGHAAFDLPRRPVKEAAGPSADAIAPAIGIAPSDVGLDDWPIERWSAGNPFALVPIQGLDAMRRCAVDPTHFGEVFRGGGRAAFLFCRETQQAGHAFHARMFGPAIGIAEDPATGSAVAAFAGYLAEHGNYPDGDHVVRIEQGYEMGRPSLIELTIGIAGGRLSRAAIAGDAVVVMEGTIS